METKLILFCILSLVMGIIFIATGIYFLSSKFLKKLNEASGKNSKEVLKKNFRYSKGCGYVSLALGFLTLLWTVIIFLFPAYLTTLALVYMIFLLAAVVFLVFIMK